jgi:hypothetical protein
MRLLLACIFLFLAPAGALLVTDRYVAGLESDFLQDASHHVARLNRVLELFPRGAGKMPNAAAIAQLRKAPDGARVATMVCGAPDSPYQRLFERLATRCGQWELFRRARRSAMAAVLFTAFAWALVLMARITVRRYANRRRWPGNWTLWFVLRGLPVVIAIQVAVSLIGYGVVLQTLTGKTAYALAILAAPFAALFWTERRLVLAFVEPETLSAFRPQGVKGRKPRPAHS